MPADHPPQSWHNASTMSHTWTSAGWTENSIDATPDAHNERGAIPR